MSTAEERIAELEAELAHVCTLEQISRGLNSARNEAELLQVLVMTGLPAGCLNASLYYFDLKAVGEPEWAEVVTNWPQNTIPPGQRFYLPEFPLFGLLIASPDEPLLIADLAADKRVDDNTRNTLTQWNIQAIAIIPMARAGRWVGMITFNWVEPRQFNPQDVDIYRVLPALVTPVAENQRLVNRLEQKIEEHARLLAELSIFKALADNANDYVAYVGLDESLPRAYVNPAGLAMIGRTKQDINSLRITDTHPPEIGRRVMEEYFPLAIKKGFWAGDSQLLRADGSCIDVSQVIFPIRDDQGRPLVVATIMRDITKHRWLLNSLEQMAEERAAEAYKSQEMLKNILNAVPQNIFWKDKNLTYLGCNQNFARTCGLTTPEDVIGKTDYDIPWSREQADTNRTDDLEVMETNRPKPRVVEHLQQVGGSQLWIEMSKIPLRDETNDVIGVLGVFTDITERKWTEDALDQQRRILQALLDNMPIGVLMVEVPSGKPILSNRRAGELLGRGIMSDVNKDTMTEVYQTYRYGTDELYPTETLARTMQGETVYVDDMEVRKPDGRRALLEVYGSPIYDKDGTIRWSLASFQDITERKESEIEQIRLQQEIITAQRHALRELSTPIIPIMDRIIVMPLIGSVDSLRAREVTRSLLTGISQHRAKIVILDITGVPLVDSGVATHLNKTIQAARLKGAQVIVTGISDAVAETVVELGINWGNTETLADLQTGLVVALNSLGVKLTLS